MSSKMLDKAQRTDRIRRMLSLLQEEESNGGFNEFPQFCEELVIKLLDEYVITEQGLLLIMKEIEKASSLGITRRSVHQIEKRGFSACH